jgi:hypothetical protein
MKRIGFVVLTALVFACSSSSSGSAAVSTDTACADYATAICTKASTCSVIFLEISYGDTAACTTRFKSLCASAFAAHATSLTTDHVEKCIAALSSAGCDALYDRNTPADCRSTAGTLANGTACGDDNQCTSAYCNKGASSICGTCGVARSKVGEACTQDDNCDYGLVCIGGGMTPQVCAARGGAGATCDAQHPCSTALACNVTSMAGMPASGTCITPNAEGAACTTGLGLGSCDVLKAGDFCNPKSLVCQKLPIAAGGAACGFDPMTGIYTACAKNALCHESGPPPGMSVCIAAAADGAACDTTNGPPCTAGATCVNKVCQQPDASGCK